MDTANKIRNDFKQMTLNKVEWYKQKGKELVVTARSIQNIYWIELIRRKFIEEYYMLFGVKLVIHR